MPTPTLQQALALLQQNAVDDAIAVLNDIVDRVPAHAAAHVLRARAFEANRDWDAALRAWEQARFLVPTSPTVADGKQRVLHRLDPTADAPSARAAASSTSEAPPSTGDGAESSASAGPSLASASEALSELDRLRREADAADSPSPDEGRSTPDDAVPPELQQLRQQADAEARTGGARGSMLGAPSDETADDDLSGLEQLRRQAEAEARRGGARGGSLGERSSSDSDDATPASASDLDADFDDLDRLIDDLESARITPTPGPEDAPEPDAMDPETTDDEDDADDLVSETLARIYASQGKYREAMRAYLKLATQKPDRMRPLLEKAAEMREEAERAAADDT